MLKDFEEYCLAHPDERFWQALRNWSGYTFIYGQREGDFAARVKDYEDKTIDLEDTFYVG